MADHDSYGATISDGDTLSDGYFNGIQSEFGKLGTNGNVMCPIGSVVAWLKTMTGVPALPSGWVECDGSVISDGTSPMNGQTIPDLNGDNRFLRGASTSGGTGGSATHTHTGTPNAGAQYLSGAAATPALATQFTTDATSTLPTYYEVVWIIRIK